MAAVIAACRRFTPADRPTLKELRIMAAGLEHFTAAVGDDAVAACNLVNGCMGGRRLVGKA